MTLPLNLDIHGELIIDNFAGGGGASTGIELALADRLTPPALPSNAGGNATERSEGRVDHNVGRHF